MCVCAVAELPPRDGPVAGLTQRGANILARSCTCNRSWSEKLIERKGTLNQVQLIVKQVTASEMGGDENIFSGISDLHD